MAIALLLPRSQLAAVRLICEAHMSPEACPHGYMLSHGAKHMIGDIRTCYKTPLAESRVNHEEEMENIESTTEVQQRVNSNMEQLKTEETETAVPNEPQAAPLSQALQIKLLSPSLAAGCTIVPSPSSPSLAAGCTIPQATPLSQALQIKLLSHSPAAGCPIQPLNSNMEQLETAETETAVRNEDHTGSVSIRMPSEKKARKEEEAKATLFVMAAIGTLQTAASLVVAYLYGTSQIENDQRRVEESITRNRICPWRSFQDP
ncbi:hypothetical protein ACLOJK_017556 [Asimina triloba]